VQLGGVFPANLATPPDAGALARFLAFDFAKTVTMRGHPSRMGNRVEALARVFALPSPAKTVTAPEQRSSSPLAAFLPQKR
jgi:hypothetical protein